ncbi:hypothetical protein [Weissella confusa]|uniref:hypothetical protein n=1 Tax=Weissella confusa TaxID=1583 RepID=UPI00223A8B1D|nr:hypothetical protein [Weissella confusa]MCS9990632.1 hypothetical protein [Weissella confusa]
MKGVKVIGAVALVFLLGFGGAMAWSTVADGRHATQEEMTQSKSSKSSSSVSSNKSSAAKSTVDSQSSASSSSDTAVSVTPTVKSETSEVAASQSSSSEAQPAASIQTAPATANTSQDAINAVIAYERANGGLSSDVTYFITANTGSVYQIEARVDNPSDPSVTNMAGLFRYDATTGQVTHMDQMTGSFN